ncbi:peptidase dimerization domain-containing protein, partial [Clostridium perfringens]
LRMFGQSCHAMEPNNGVNAVIKLAQFLQRIEFDDAGRYFIHAITESFSNDTRGKKLNIACEDKISGELTLNVGTFRYEKAKGG